MLGELGDAQAVPDECRHDLAGAVVPLVAALVLPGAVGVGIGLRRVFEERFVLLEVRVGDAQIVIGERPGHRVHVVQVEPPAGAEESADHPRPHVDVRQPAQGSEADVDHIEDGPVECGRGLVDTGADKRGSLGQSGPRSQLARRVDGHRGEVQPGYLRPGAGPGQGVEAEVALGVQQPEALHVPQSVDLTSARPGLIAQPPFDVIEARLEVDAHPFVPLGLVGGDQLVPAGHLALPPVRTLATRMRRTRSAQLDGVPALPLLAA